MGKRLVQVCTLDDNITVTMYFNTNLYRPHIHMGNVTLSIRGMGRVLILRYEIKEIIFWFN